MDEYNVILSMEDANDMSAIYDYILEISGTHLIAMAQFNRIADAINTLTTLPERAGIMDNPYCKANQLRQLLVDNYSVIFTIRHSDVFIARVIYSASDIASKLQE